MDLTIPKEAKEQIHPIFLVLGISATIFFGVFLFCSYLAPKNSVLSSVKDNHNSVSPAKPRINAPVMTDLIPVRPVRR